MRPEKIPCIKGDRVAAFFFSSCGFQAGSPKMKAPVVAGFKPVTTVGRYDRHHALSAVDTKLQIIQVIFLSGRTHVSALRLGAHTGAPLRDLGVFLTFMSATWYEGEIG